MKRRSDLNDRADPLSYSLSLFLTSAVAVLPQLCRPAVAPRSNRSMALSSSEITPIRDLLVAHLASDLQRSIDLLWLKRVAPV
jgi:hypothetical protein